MLNIVLKVPIILARKIAKPNRVVITTTIPAAASAQISHDIYP